MLTKVLWVKGGAIGARRRRWFLAPLFGARPSVAGTHAFLNKAREFGQVADLVRSLLSGSGETAEKPV